jgi:uncharacterized protein with von Willebrand factor type A (vWA) domain
MSSHLLANLVLFGRVLRAAGLPVQAADIADFVTALEYLDLGCREDVRAAGRTIFVHRQEHLALFDRLFDWFWQQRPGAVGLPPAASADKRLRRQERRLPGLPGRVMGAVEGADDETGLLRAYSAVEILRTKRFADLTPDELETVERLIRATPWEPPRRRSRRQKPAPHGAYPDWRRTLRRSLRYGGELVRLARRRRRYKPRPLVVLCDVSGSMARYSRVLLQFIYALSRRGDHIEAFVFSTRLTRITPHLRHRSPDQALAAVAEAAPDMGGGTQIGLALKTFNYAWARRVLGRGAIVLLISDGWDRGDPELIRREMERLHRSTHRLIWLNPLLGSPAYEPLTRGMLAALPAVDDFLSAADLASLEALAALLARRMNGSTSFSPTKRYARIAL